MKANKPTKKMRCKIVFLLVSFSMCFVQSCSTEGSLKQNESNIKTVSKEEAILFLKSQNNLPINTSKTTNFTFEFEKITQEKTSHKEALITVIPVKSDTKGKKTCVILWKVDNAIETIIYNEYASETSTITSFTGIIIMTRLNGDFVRAYKLKNNDYVIDLVPIKKDATSKSSNSLEEEAIGLQEVIVINDFKKTSYTFVPMIDGSNKTVSDLEDYYWLKSGGGGGVVASNEEIAQAIEDNIDDSLLDPCTKAILDKLKNLTQSKIAKIFTKLGGNSEIYTLTFEIANNNGNPASTSQTSYNCYKTVIDNDFLYGIDGTGINKPPTDLAIAAVMIHEVVHAYFFSLYDDKVNSGITNALDDFDLLYQKYVTENYVGADDAQHAQIWKSFIKILAASLQEYHTGDGANPSQFYQDIILGTLSRTQIFKDKYPEGTAEFRRIMDNYRTATSNGKTISNSTPVGTPCQ